MPLQGEYLGMDVYVDDLDQDNLAFFSHCGNHELRLQQCTACNLMRFPPTSACPFCAHPDSDWVPVSGKGVVYSYGEVHHAIQPAFREFSPYMLLLVELDEQKDVPNAYDGLRVQGNLAAPDGNLADAELVRQVGIGTRVKVFFKDLSDDLAMPLWVVDEDAPQSLDNAQEPVDKPWRYPIE